MKRNALHIALTFIFLYGGTFAVAPMMFCATVQKKPVSSCCEQKPIQPFHSEKSDEGCPICAHNFCKVDEAPAKLTTNSPSAAIVTIVAVLSNSIYSTHSGQYISQPVAEPSSDSSPPLFLRDCDLRI
jgi:hypothetical protein